MRASELIGSEVRDGSGRKVGVVRDLRVDAGRAVGGGFPLLGLVVGEAGLRSAAAHAWGYAEGRAKGPAPFARLLAPAAERAVFVEAGRVRDWGPDPVVVDGPLTDLPAPREGER